MKAGILLIGLLVAALLTACATQQPAPPAAPGQSGAGEQQAGSNASGGNIVEINITARQFAFDPSTIRVKRGDRVIIHVTSADVTHGLLIEGYNQNVAVPPGETKTLDFIADKPGTFKFRCSVPCGSGHMNMTGELIVE